MNIEKIKPPVAVLIVGYCSIFFEVLLSFFLLSRPLFYSLSTTQLAGIGLGISIPIAFINYGLWATFMELDYNTSENKDENEINSLFGGLLLTFLIFNMLLLVSYAAAITIKEFYWLLAGSEILAGITLFVRSKSKWGK